MKNKLAEIISIINDMCIDEKVEAINEIKKELHIISPFKEEPVDCVLWIKQENIHANDYNPNSVAPPEMKLLHISIQEDGYTQPIVTMLEENLLHGMDKIDFVLFSKSITDLIESELNKTVIAIAIEPCKKMINDFVSNLEKKEWKLSEIIELYKEREVIPEANNESGEIAFVHEVSDYGTIWVGFGEESKGTNHRYQCKYRIGIDAKSRQMYSPIIDDKVVHPLNECGIYGFDLFLFKLYATGCTIIDDYENVETGWSTYN